MRGASHDHVHDSTLTGRVETIISPSSLGKAFALTVSLNWPNDSQLHLGCHPKLVGEDPTEQPIRHDLNAPRNRLFGPDVCAVQRGG